MIKTFKLLFNLEDGFIEFSLVVKTLKKKKQMNCCKHSQLKINQNYGYSEFYPK